MQKQLGIRMQAKRAAMLAENNMNFSTKDDEDDEEEVEEVDEDSMDTTNESNNDVNSDIISNVDKENIEIDEETRQSLSELLYRNNNNY